MKITIKLNNTTNKITAKKGSTILEIIARNGYKIVAPCGGNGRCGNCKVKLISGKVSGCKIDADQSILACHSYPETDCIIELPNNQIVSGKENHAPCAPGLPPQPTKCADGYFIDCDAIAVDVGTTTISACLIEGGAPVNVVTESNEQSVYGADVITRILHATNNLKSVRDCLLNQLAKMVKQLLQNRAEIDNIVISANTTMLHILANQSTEGLGQSPFKTAFTSSKYFYGNQLNLPCTNVVLLPSINAFLGADILGGIAAIDLLSKSGSLLLDLGTNGEMALSHNGKIFCCSAATGSAFEGAEITCGMGGEIGAINSVRQVGGNICYTTIGEGAARGICGAGLIDAVACLRQMQEIDSDGLLLENQHYFTKDVYISQADVRTVQLAKSAVACGIEVLLAAAGISAQQVTKVYLTGGMGFYLNEASAIAIKMFPKWFEGKTEIKANLSLMAAYGAALTTEFIKQMDELKNSIIPIELSLAENFDKLFMQKLQL